MVNLPSWRIFAIAALIILIIVLFAPYGLGRLDCYNCTEAKDIAKAISDARSALTQIALAAGAGGTLFFTWRNSLQSAEDSRAARALTQEARTSENFIKAVEQMGSDKPTLHVGGIFGLGRVLQNAKPEGDYWPVMDVLTAFVRENFPISDPSRRRRRAGNAPEDLQAALNVLARRSVNGQPPDRGGKDSPIDLHESNLTDTWMANGHFESGFFVGCNFTGANLTNSKFQYANFSKAVLDKAEMGDSDWTKVSFGEEVFGYADFGAADLRDADLSQATGLDDPKLICRALWQMEKRGCHRI
jgi:hypothetical protein